MNPNHSPSEQKKQPNDITNRDAGPQWDHCPPWALRVPRAILGADETRAVAVTVVIGGKPSEMGIWKTWVATYILDIVNF